jgi:hypothetical protein
VKLPQHLKKISDKLTTNLSQTLSSTGAPFKPSSVIKPVARHHSGVSGLATTSSIDFDGQSVTRTMQREALSSSSSSTSSSAVIAGASPLANRKRPISVLENNTKERKLDNTKEKTETTALDDLLGKLVSSSSSSFSHSSAPTLSRTMISSSLSDTEDHQYPSLSNTGTVQVNLGTETDFGVVIRPSKRIAVDTSNITRDLDVKSNSTSTLKSRQQEFLYASGARRDAKNQSEELVQVQQRKVMTQGANPPQRKRQAQDGYNEVLDGETGGDIDVESATAHQEYYDEYEEDEDEDMHEDELLIDEEIAQDGTTNKSSWKLIESKPNGKRARDIELTSTRQRHGNSQILSLSSSSTLSSSKKMMMVETLKPRQMLPLSRQVISGSGKGTSGRFLLSSSSASSGAAASSANASSAGGIIRSKGGILISRETVKNMVTVGTQTVPMSEAGVQTFSRAASSASSLSYSGDVDSSFNSNSFSSSSAFDGSRSRLRRVQPSIGSTLDYSLSSGVQSNSAYVLGDKDKDNSASILASSSSSAQAFKVMQQPTTEKDSDLSSSKAHVGGSQEPIKSFEGGERNVNNNETPSFSFGTAKVEKTTTDFAAPTSSSSFSFSFGKPTETAQTSTALDTLKPSVGDAGGDEEDDRRRKLKKPSVSFPGLPPISSSSSEQTPVPTSTSGAFSFAPIPSPAPVHQQAKSNSETSTSSSAPPPPVSGPAPVSAPASASTAAPAPFSFGSGNSSGSLFGNGSFGLAPSSSSSAPVNLFSATSAVPPPPQSEKVSTSVPFSLVDSGSKEAAPTDMNKTSLFGSAFSSTAPSTVASIPPPTATASLSTFTFGSSSSSLFSKSSDLIKTNSLNKEGGGGELGLPNTTSSSNTNTFAPASTSIVFGSQPSTSNLQSTTQLVPSFSFSSSAPQTALSLGGPTASTASSVPTSLVNPNANPGSATSQWDTPASTLNNAPSSSSFGFSVPGSSTTTTFSSTIPSIATGTTSAPPASTGSATAATGTGAAAMLASTFSFGGSGGGFGNTTFPPPPASFSFGTAAPPGTSTLPAFGTTSLGGATTGASNTTTTTTTSTTSVPGAPLAALTSFTFGQSFQPQSSISSTSSFGLSSSEGGQVGFSLGAPSKKAVSKKK